MSRSTECPPRRNQNRHHDKMDSADDRVNGGKHNEVKHRVIGGGGGGGRVLSRVDSQVNPWRSSHSDSKMGALGKRTARRKKGTSFGGGDGRWMAFFTLRHFPLIFPVPHLPHEVCHVNLLVLHVQDPRMFQHPPGCRASRRFFLKTVAKDVRGKEREKYQNNHQNIPAFNEILEVIRPANIVLRLILEFGNRLSHDVCKEIDETGAGLHLRPVCREGESMLCNFQKGHAQRPNIRRDCV